jgi:hypothetical protein
MSCPTTSYRFPTVIFIVLDVARNCEYKVIQGKNHKDTHNYNPKEQAETKDADDVVDFVSFFEEVNHVRV